MKGASRKIQHKALALCLGIVLALLLGEILLRSIGLPPKIIPIERWRMKLSENPDLLYEPIANIGIQNAPTDTYITSGEISENLNSQDEETRNHARKYSLGNQFALYPDTSNSLGFRGKDPETPKNPNKTRILLLGDSVVTGIWIADPNELLHIKIQTLLNKTQLPSEVLNFGVPGYTTAQEVAILEDRGLNLQPEIVIIAYCLNDSQIDNGGILDALYEDKLKTSQKPKTTPWKWANQKSALLYTVTHLLSKHTNSKLKNNTQTLNELQRKNILNLQKQYEGDKAVKKALEKFKSLSINNNFLPLIAILPDNPQNLEEKTHSKKEREKILQVSQKIGIAAIDLQAPFAEKTKGNPPFFDRYHMKSEGHKTCAEILTPFIKENIKHEGKPK
jgi:lysophospholipase L1-like esterase